MTLTTFHLKGIENKQSSQFMKPLYIWSQKGNGGKTKFTVHDTHHFTLEGHGKNKVHSAGKAKKKEDRIPSSWKSTQGSNCGLAQVWNKKPLIVPGPQQRGDLNLCVCSSTDLAEVKLVWTQTSKHSLLVWWGISSLRNDVCLLQLCTVHLPCVNQC